MFQKTKLFCGRSMLEMLGVLAIIGMLSLTALGGNGYYLSPSQ